MDLSFDGVTAFYELKTVLLMTANGHCEDGNDCVCSPDWTGLNCDQGMCDSLND